MSNFSINFSHPWLLLLFIPAILLTFIPHFRIAKRYRRVRNRIVSLVLHLMVMTLCILVLSGLNFSYDKKNVENEILLLVDISDNGRNTVERKEKFIRSFLTEIGSSCRVGLVTFGYDQSYVSELGSRTDQILADYLAAGQTTAVDTTATDISAALLYAQTLFQRPESGKVILLSDGMETDGNARTAVRSLAAAGIRVDTVDFSDLTDEYEVQIIDVELPDFNVAVGADFSFKLKLQSNYNGIANVTLVDNGTETDAVALNFQDGISTVELTHSYAVPGMHKLEFRITGDGDTVLSNNKYSAYMYLDNFDKILILESIEGESEQLYQLLTDNPFKNFDVTTILISDTEKVPDSVNGLRDYDQVILMNIANRDMPENFDELLHSYVHDVGGGLLTVGGNKPDSDEANAYDREDMYLQGQQTLYQQMLPVQSINYTPPTAVVIIIDRSGSMGGTDPSSNKDKLDLAKEGAKQCLNALTERDWCGVIALDTTAEDKVALTPVTNYYRVVQSIDEITIGGGTSYAPSIRAAGAALSLLDTVEHKHIILVTDGLPGDSLDSDYGPAIIENYEQRGITFSIVSIGVGQEADLRVAAVEYGHGRFYSITYGEFENIPTAMTDELRVPDIKDVVFDPEGFVPTIKKHTPVVSGISDSAMEDIRLYGYYGTKAKTEAEVVLTGKYVPLYAQWKYGKGTVGSFMCDLNGTWSSNIFSKSAANDTGAHLIYNIVTGLFPTQNIRASEIEAVFIPENYTTRVNIYATLQPTETLELLVNGMRVQTATASENYTRLSFEQKVPGVHEITLRKLDSEGNVLAEHISYQEFSYSAEYNEFADQADGVVLMRSLAQSSGGEVLSEQMTSFVSLADQLHRVIDPRIAFLIAAIVLFLLDIAVRKFKFKWIHEIVRERREKKEAEQSNEP